MREFCYWSVFSDNPEGHMKARPYNRKTAIGDNPKLIPLEYCPGACVKKASFVPRKN